MPEKAKKRNRTAAEPNGNYMYILYAISKGKITGLFINSKYLSSLSIG